MKYELIVVLVRTESSGNIGSSLRALANMGGSRMILINPQCSPFDEFSRMAAAGAQDFFDRVCIYRDWDQFNTSESQGFKWAFTRRKSQTCPLLSPNSAVQRISDQRVSLQNPIYLIFGPEKCGLSRSEVEQAHAAIELNTFGDFQSLNLSQAILLGLYQVQSAMATMSLPQFSTEDLAADHTQVNEVELLLKAWLTSIGFDWRKRRSSAFKTLRRLILSSHPTDHDLHVLTSVFRMALGPDSALLLKEIVHDLR